MNFCPGFGDAPCGIISFATRELSSSLCGPCRAAKNNFVKREERKQANRAEQVKAGSRTNVTLLTPDRRKERRTNERKAARSVRDRLRYAQTRLESDASKAAFTLEKDGVLLELFKKAAEQIESDRTGARSALLEGLVVEAAKEEAGSTLTTEQQDQCAALASLVLDEVKNVSRRLAEKPTAVRFSPRVMRLALGLWMKSPSAYKVLQESGLLVVPSVTTLKRTKAAAAVSDGLCPEIFGWLSSNFKNHSGEKGMAGHLMCDEIKIKSGVAWNTATHRTVGLVGREGRVSLTDEVKSLLRGEAPPEGGETAAAEESETATYVNQWKLRSVYGRTFLLSFFFNGGSLAGDELMRQLLHVSLMAELAGVRVLGLCLDAGGGNSSLASLLRGGEGVGDCSWLSEELVTFASPADPSRKTAVFFCSTHNLKAQRNALASSKRSFASADGVSFGLESIKRCHARDQARRSSKTKLTASAVDPDRWEKMRVNLAKAVFDQGTTDEMIFHIGESLDILSDLTSSGCGGEEVQWRALTSRRIEVLKKKLAESKETLVVDGDKFGELQEDLAEIEHNFHVGTIFVENFLNGEARVTPENIDKIEAEVKSALDYFEAWRMASLQLKAKKDPAWEKAFISTITYRNLRIGVRGFFSYCRSVFQLPDPPSYVPFLHSNQSSLEATFSHIRRVGGDSSLNYPSAITTINTHNSIKILNSSNPCYNGDKSEVGRSWGRLEELLGRTDDSQALTVKSWWEGRKNAAEVAVAILPPADNDGELRVLGSTDRFRSLYNAMSSYSIPSNFSYYLSCDETFEGVARVSIGTSEEKHFKAMATLSDDDETLLNAACQNILLTIFTSLDESIQTKSGHKSSFWWHQKEFITGKKLAECRKLFPVTCQSQVFAALVTFHLGRLFGRWLDEAIIEITTTTPTTDAPSTADGVTGTNEASMSDAEINSEVTNFVGWAMKEALDHYRDQWQRSEEFLHGEEDEDEDEAISGETNDRKCVRYIKSMRLLHRHAIEDAEYLHKYYAPIDQIRNRGGMFLLAPSYVLFAKTLMERTRSLVNSNSFKMNGNSTIKTAYDAIIDNKDLWKLFSEANNDVDDLPEDIAKDIFLKIVKKAFHARAGEATRRYKEEQVDKKDMALRPKLKAMGGAKKKLDVDFGADK